MKSTLQIVLAIVVLVVVVISLTFIAHFSWYAGEPNKNGSQPVDPRPPGAKGVIELPSAAHNDEEEASKGIYHPEYEVNVPYHRDFWFTNRQSVEAQVQLQIKSCTCSNARIATVSPALWRKTQEESALPSQLVTSLISGGAFLDVFSPVALANMGKELDWQELSEGGNAVTIPAAVSKDLPTLGILRLGWTAEKEGPVRLTAAFGARQKETDRWEIYGIEASHTIVPALRMHPQSLDLGAMSHGEMRQGEFFCWSASRGSFEVEFHEKTQDPCVVCEVTPLTADECRRLEERLQGKQPTRPYVKAGYRLRVTVHERKSEQVQMDLGPFQRQVILKSPLAEQSLTSVVAGAVRGEIRILSADGKDRIDFENFPASRTKQVKLTLASDQPGIDLQLDDVVPALLKVKLTEIEGATGSNRKQWLLDVEVPANSASGRFPATSAIVLKTQGSTSRKIRIPVSGTAYAQ